MSSLENLIGNMSVTQLADTAGISVTALVELVLGGQKAKKSAPAARAKAPREAAKPAARAGKKAAPAGAAHNTRTQAGREALDAAILEFLGGRSEPSRALEVKAAVGGTSAQVRARLNTLIEERKVSFSGKASGTRYQAK